MEYSVEKINEIALSGHFGEFVKFSEMIHEAQLESLVRLIRERIGGAETFSTLILVTGPSASSKTTFSNLLANALKKLSYHVNYVSLDDYYLDVKITQKLQEKKGFVKTEFNDYDYECIEAFDVPAFRKNMKEYLAGNETAVPKFDFLLQRPNGIREKIKKTGKDVLLLEGIQTMNKKLTRGLKFDFVFKVYICPFDTYAYDGKVIVDPKFVRLMRRSVRNRNNRGDDLGDTLLMWGNVRRNEEKEIERHKRDADFIYNSGTPYEVNYLAPIFLKMSENLSEKYQKRLENFANIEVLKYFVPVSELELPENSVFREFYE